MATSLKRPLNLRILSGRLRLVRLYVVPMLVESSHLYNQMFKFCSNDRWNHPDLLIKKFSSYPPTENATFSSKTSCNAWFNLTCNHAPGHTGISIFFLSWWSIPHPQEQRKRQFPTPELLIVHPGHPCHCSHPSHPSYPTRTTTTTTTTSLFSIRKIL